MVVVVFRNRLRPDGASGYPEEAARMDELARTMPGFISAKTFQARDGERVTIAEFASLEAVNAWRDHPEHEVAQRHGRDRYYETYDLQVAEVLHTIRFRDGVREVDSSDSSS